MNQKFMRCRKLKENKMKGAKQKQHGQAVLQHIKAKPPYNSPKSKKQSEEIGLKRKKKHKT